MPGAVPPPEPTEPPDPPDPPGGGGTAGVPTLEGRLTGIVDRSGRGVTISYKSWTAEQIEESPERQWQIGQVTDAAGRTAVFNYAPEQVSGQCAVQQVSLRDGPGDVHGSGRSTYATGFTYWGDHMVCDETGRWRAWALNAAYMPTKMTYSDGTEEHSAYNADNQVTRQRDREGRVTRSTYDERGNLLSKEVGLGEQTAPPGGGGGPHGRRDPPARRWLEGPLLASVAYGQEPPPDPVDVPTAEHAVYQYEYYPAGHANQFLLAAEIDPNGNRTDYQYDANQRLVKVIQPPGEAGGPRAETSYTYDGAGRLKITADPVGRTTERFYDQRGRVVKILYADGSTERFFFGTGAQAGLVVKQKDRSGVVTNFEYDNAGRRIRTVSAVAMMDTNDVGTPISDPSLTVEETLTYLPGRDLVATRTRGGETTA